ncbi:MAG TPA: hypothetical protein VGM10_17060 [Actinocrinis sp.]|jgi:hypothetical protein
MTPATTTVVRRQIVVQAPIERAFTVFTERFGDFKPPEHNLLKAPIAETVFEPRPGWQAVADGVANDAGWPLYLARYAALFAEGS